MKTVAIIQARMGSSRLPGKVLRLLRGRPVLDWVVDAAELAPGVDDVVVATSTAPGDDAVAAWAGTRGVTCFRGSENDVLDRFAGAARHLGADIIVRLTADCPLLDPAVIGQVVLLRDATDADYVSNVDPPTWPDGLDVEVFTAKALKIAAKEAVRGSDREHVTPFVRNNRARFKVENLTCPVPGLERYRWTLDAEADWSRIAAIAERLPTDRQAGWAELIRAADSLPAVTAPPRNEGFARSVAADLLAASPSYERSSALLGRAERTIPLGSQTFSKSRVQYPLGAAPLFLTHGHRGRSWDVDGNEYVDLVSGLLPVVLGYRDPDVDRAIRRQLDRGISFSLATDLEVELAERLHRLIPCAEMVRFGKNGTDATSAAVRLARAHTRRDRVLVCGYHGWQDWYIGATTRHLGVPPAVRELTHVLPYGDLDAVEALLKAHPKQIAAMVLEPTNVAPPPAAYLQDLKTLLHRHGALLVFDEVITGFRWSLGGAQAVYGVVPDLAAFGKAMGNGMPISAVAGRADVMRRMEDIFFSGTFGGEALSLAAAIATIDKMEREKVIERLWSFGAELHAAARERIHAHGLAEVIAHLGQSPWHILAFQDHGATPKEAVKTLFLQEMFSAGVLTNGSHNVCWAHDARDLAHVAAAYDRACGAVATALKRGDLAERLGNRILRPVFSVR